MLQLRLNILAQLLRLGNTPLIYPTPNLKSKAECLDFAQKVFLANVEAKYEYTLTTFEGAYLEENDVVTIIDDTTAVEGNFRIVGKTINFGEGGFGIDLIINKQPPLLSQFLVH